MDNGNQNFLGQVIDAISHPVYVINANNHTITLANSAAGTINGRPTCYSVMFKKNSPCKGFCPIEEVKKTKKPVILDSVKYDKRGVGRDVEIRVDPMFDSRGNIVHVVKHILEISEGNRVNKALRDAREYSRNLIDSSLDMIISVDKMRNIVEFNKAAERAFGYAKKEVIGKSVRMFYANPEDASKVAEDIAKDGRFHGEILNRRKNGELFVAFLSSTCLEDGYGNSLGSMGISRDITEQKKAEEELQRSKESLADAQKIAKIGNWEWDFARDRLYWSDEIYRIFGLEPQEFATTFNEFLGYTHPKDRELLKSSVNEALYSKKPLSLNTRIVLPDGSGRIVHEQAEVTYNEEGEPIKMVGVVQDITELKRTEEALLKAKEQAEKANRLKDQFVSLVSHDLKAPLAAMTGYLKLILYDEAEPPDEGVKMILRSAIESGNKMTTLIDELLTISKLKTGVIIPRNSFVDARFAAASIIMSLQYLAERKGIILENEILKKFFIYSDMTLLQEVLRNLVSNAIKFCEKGDRITIFTPESEPSTIAVRDTGIGIEAKRQKTLFSYEVKTSTQGTEGETGTGFGLPMSMDIMKAHRGSLTVVSATGKGSVFYARFPHARPLVLLVDDEENERNLFKAYFKKTNMEFLEAENGKTAIETLKENTPHLIITNLNMPVMNGFEFLERVKRDEKTKSIPIIMITADTNMETRRKALDMGADDFITKQHDAGEFISHVGQFIGLSYY